MCLIIDHVKDYHRACRGFSINGIRYKRLLGTNGGIKNSTIVFVSERLWGELSRRIENGRMDDVPLVTAKLEAYKALTCSAAAPVSLPNGILVVKDAKTEFFADIVYLTDEGDGEPVAETRTGEKIEMNASDGFGLMLPSLAERWSTELNLGYTAGCFNTRFAFEKGCVFAFDFREFAERVAGGCIVQDAWGNSVDVREVEMVLTTSMVKLWDCYTSCEDYLEKSLSNGYTFGVTKTSPRKLESERRSNYQFIQPLNLDDDDIEELIRPTMEEFHAVLHSDWRSSVLFMKGAMKDDADLSLLEPDYVTAMMIDERVFADPYVQGCIYNRIRKRIDQAKIGALKLHANYSIISGDPYLLCQSIFGLEKTGLLKAGEIYNQYWADSGVDELACFRAPMSTQENIRRVKPARSEECRHWFQYIPTCTILNGWDTISAALNGCDYDGDLVFLTDNAVILRRLEDLPALVCAQRRAEKRISTDEDFIQSNIDSFGNEIGQTTNYVTSMYEVRSGFDPGSEEYGILSYRIRCGQTYQQNAIDKAKGIVAKPMPREWHDRFAAARIEDEEMRELYIRISADKKPYFMRYIYPDLMREYNTYIKKADKNALREFGLTIAELESMDEEARTGEQNVFLRYYRERMPVGMNGCVMNRICRRFEQEFDGYVGRACASSTFDYTFMKSGAEYTDTQARKIRTLYKEFCEVVRKNNKMNRGWDRVDPEDSVMPYNVQLDMFRRDCRLVCPSGDSMCDLLLDICYTRSATKAFVWSMCGEEIVRNLLKHAGRVIRIPVSDDEGEYVYCGERYRFVDVEYKEREDDYGLYTE